MSGTTGPGTVGVDAPDDAPLTFSANVTLQDVADAYRTGAAYYNGLDPSLDPRSSSQTRTMPSIFWLPLVWAAVAVVWALLPSLTGNLVQWDFTWLASWAPLPFALSIWALCFQPRIRLALTMPSIKKVLKRAFPGYPAGGRIVEFSIGSATLHVRGLGRELQLSHIENAIAAENKDQLTLIVNDALLPIPKRDLPMDAIAALRAKLNVWGPVRQASGPSLGPGAKAQIAVIMSCGIAVFAQMGLQSALPATSRSEIRSIYYSVAINDEHPQDVRERYDARLFKQHLHDSVTGSFKTPSASGSYYITRSITGGSWGYRVIGPDEERKNLNFPGWGIPDIPLTAEMTRLPGRGHLIAWANPLNGGGTEACAARTTYRDPASGTDGVLYGRLMRLRFCSKTLNTVELAAWLDTAGDALDQDFTARTKP